MRGPNEARPAPMIYEINTWVWLGEMERRYGGRMGLQHLPQEAWDELAVPGIDTVWLMGVWERSPLGRAIAAAEPDLRQAFRQALSEIVDDDIIGSPYCVRDYVVDERLGGLEGLRVAREQLAKRDLALFLDYVPNHVAPDHPWLDSHPEFFIRGTAADLGRDPGAYLPHWDAVIARGRDPFFPPWPDVVQLNAFDPGLRTATAEVLSRIAELCDGVRCDMAMLMMNDVFARTWGDRVGPRPQTEFWPEVIGRVKREHPTMVFVAEAYWGLEWALQQQGFDFCYDKLLYDRLLGENIESVRGHLHADSAYQRGLFRFLENHDEPRAATAFPPAKERAAAVMIATLPGATLWHEGQFEGRQVKVPAFLARRPEEPPTDGLRAFHERLLSVVENSGMREGTWQLIDCHGWDDNYSCNGIVSWCWSSGEVKHLVVANMMGQPAQALVPLPWSDLPGRMWTLRDLLSEASYERDGAEMRAPGLYVALDAWGANVFEVQPIVMPHVSAAVA
jgi:hypothetical protein